MVCMNTETSRNIQSSERRLISSDLWPFLLPTPKDPAKKVALLLLPSSLCPRKGLRGSVCVFCPGWNIKKMLLTGVRKQPAIDPYHEVVAPLSFWSLLTSTSWDSSEEVNLFIILIKHSIPKILEGGNLCLN
ncbi:hypothetical protein E2320_015844 [Naja naja]|nr:hypothetical protein E2320_015844 [Naja naja]